MRIYITFPIIVVWTLIFWGAYGLSHVGLINYQAPNAMLPIGGMGIAVLASLFSLGEGKWKALKGMWSPVFRWRIGPINYLFGLIPALLIALSIMVFAPVANIEGYAFAAYVAPGILVGLVFATIEEVTWRGYVLPRLLQHHSPLFASGILAVGWTIWHAPMYLVPGYNAFGFAGYFYWAPFYFVYTYFLTWLFMRSGGSVLICILSHFFINYVITWFEPASMENYGALIASIILVPIVIIIFRKLPSLENSLVDSNSS